MVRQIDCDFEVFYFFIWKNGRLISDFGGYLKASIFFWFYDGVIFRVAETEGKFLVKLRYTGL